jgi:hypothetical protein
MLAVFGKPGGSSLHIKRLHVFDQQGFRTSLCLRAFLLCGSVDDLELCPGLQYLMGQAPKKRNARRAGANKYLALMSQDNIG